MPQRAWSDKRERQYEHIKSSQEERGVIEGRAKEIAARTVNKNRAQSGEARQRSTTSTEDISPQRRGGLRSGNRQGPGGRTKGPEPSTSGSCSAEKCSKSNFRRPVRKLICGRPTIFERTLLPRWV
ncbi:MAG: hypothetical protein ACRDRP_19235 [Pseudonocardiaceae bacterium]